MAGHPEYDVVLLPSFIQVEAWRRRAALAAGRGIFAQTATTFNAWVADLWERYGDGRMLVDSVGRAVLMRLAFAQLAAAAGGEDAAGGVGGGAAAGEAPAGQALTLSPGVALEAARCELEAAGVSEYDAAVRAAGSGAVPAGLSVREALFLSGIARYRELLASRSLVEPGEACRLLAEVRDEAFPRPLRVLVANAAPPDWHMQRLFAACPRLEVHVEEAPGAFGIVRAPEGTRVRIAEPSGRYAQAGLVMRLVEGLPAGGRMVVACADPLAMYRELEPALARRGLAGGVQATVRFAEVDFGRAFLLALRAVHDDDWAPADFADLLRSPFAGVGPGEARAYDARLRADRIVSRETARAELCDRSEGLTALVALARGESPEALLARFDRIAAEAPGRSPAWRSQQHAAVDGLRAVLRFADIPGAGWRDLATVLGQLAVTVSALGLPPQGAAAPAVTCTTQGAAAQMAPGSCEVLVAAGLTADRFPLAERDDAATTLFAKLGLVPADDALSRARRVFTALMRLPSRELVCMREANDVDGNPAYPCAMLEELLEAYRPAGESGEQSQPGIPAALAGDVLRRGEQELYANARACAGAAVQPVAARVAPAAPGSLGVASEGGLPGGMPLSDVMLPPRRIPPDGGLLRASPSPSQIEFYLECPYRWFAERRMGLSTLEEGFGPLERGEFAHAALERFYRAFMQEGFPKVTADNLDRARKLMRQAALAVRRGMRAWRPGSGRWVAANRIEEHEIDQMTDQLVEFLDYERQLLPGFHPAYLEYAFDPARPVAYAGRPLVGTVDRIDVDDAGHAVVIDYKAAVGPEHDIGGKDAADPGKVQARIYAQMVRRALGLQVVGAVYLSYGAAHRMAGAADSRALESAHLPGARGEAIWCALQDAPAPEEAAGEPPALSELAFPAMLDATEGIVAEALGRMEAGDVAPAPANAKVCGRCPVADCPGRLAKARG